MKNFSKISILSIAGFAGPTALAAPPNPFYAPGDLVIAFQKPGDTDTVYASLGNAATLYRGAAVGADVANSLNILDLNAVLTSAFGAGWASDPMIFAGVAGMFNDSVTSSALTNGDPTRTIYISSPRDSVGTVGAAESFGWDLTLSGNTAMSSASTGIQTQNNIFENNYDQQAALSPTSLSQIDDQNPFLTLSPLIQGSAMADSLVGGIQQAGGASVFGTFGPAGEVEFALDLYRVLARATGGSGFTAPIPGQVAGPLRVGTYEGTITVSTTGKVSFIAQGTATPFQTWALTFPALDTAAKRLPDADPDNDGLTNLMEFVLNGNPGTVDPSVVPTLNASGTDFVFSFARRDDSEAGSTLVFQYSTDLTGWTDTTVGASGGVVGAATVVVTENSTNPDAITVTVPKTTAPGGRLFGRLKVSQP